MRIEQSKVTMNAGREFSSQREVSLDTRYNFRTLFDSLSQAVDEVSEDKQDRELRVLMMLEALLERLLEQVSGKPCEDAKITELREKATATGAQAQPARVAVMEWRSEFIERINEHERTSFSSSGTVHTADGRTLDFSLGLDMNRDFETKRQVVKGGVAELRDPLVINFEGRAAELSGARFEFDLDADGKAENLRGLAEGSGFLAVDRNGDGKINDGSELFGTRSGNGFADLARLDQDGNRWIDENDAAFSSLKVWQRDAQGKESLSNLTEQGVGALYLDFADTPFALTDEENRLLAQIRASGLYLREDGSAGTLQQIDLAG